MKWRIVANGAALVVTISLSTTFVGGRASRTDALSTVKSGGGSAIGLLQNIRVENEHSAGYVRALFEHWRDIDGDGCDSREQVLKRDSVTLPQVDPYKCKVIAGDWVSPYDGAKWSDPTDIDIDHVVALKEAWDSGAWAWSSATRKAYANDTSDRRTLLAVTDSVNQQKSDKDPSNWIPPRKSDICVYLGDWISIKARWNLSMDQSEWGRIKNLLNSSCVGLIIAPWEEAPLMGTMLTAPTTAPATTVPKTAATSTTTTAPTATSPTATSPTATSPASVGVSVYPGAWCKPEGATGVYTNGKSYVCAKTNASGVAYSDGRARWRQG
ncbi:MAG: HNH endonuclease [Actinobacteria bacterium]|nr:MAG: HNH endonuclease [Actinomycetota bacterium]